jgi:hypothetical protein
MLLKIFDKIWSLKRIFKVAGLVGKIFLFFNLNFYIYKNLKESLDNTVAI